MPTETQHLEQRVAALQSDLNARDQALDDAATENNEREMSRRSWFDEAKRLEKENEGLRSEVKRLDLMVSQADHDYEMKRNDLERQLAERDALLEDWHTANATGEVKISDKAYRIVTRTAAAQSASAEPKCSKCGDSGVIDDKEIDQLPGGHFTERGLVACPDCEDLSAPVSSTSDKYKAELYDEVWQLARGMGFGNVTDALMKLQSQLQGEPVAWRVQRVTPTGNHRLDRPLLTLATPEEWGPAWNAEPLYTRPAEQWQPIETAPKDGTEIILRKGDRITAGAWIEWSNSAAEFHATTGVYLGDVEYDSGADWSSWDGGFCKDDLPTHWQPLPTPPQQ